MCQSSYFKSRPALGIRYRYKDRLILDKSDILMEAGISIAKHMIIRPKDVLQLS